MAQVKALAEAETELVRITVNTPEAAAAVPAIYERLDELGCHVAAVGDFDFNGHRSCQLSRVRPGVAEYRINRATSGVPSATTNSP